MTAAGLEDKVGCRKLVTFALPILFYLHATVAFISAQAQNFLLP